MRDHTPENPPSTYADVGVVGFNAETFNNIDTKSEDYDFPFMRLLERLWPGDWRVQLGKMNDAIKESNKKLHARKHAKECSEDEWGIHGESLFLLQRRARVAFHSFTTNHRRFWISCQTLIYLTS